MFRHCALRSIAAGSPLMKSSRQRPKLSKYTAAVKAGTWQHTTRRVICLPNSPKTRMRAGAKDANPQRNPRDQLRAIERTNRAPKIHFDAASATGQEIMFCTMNSPSAQREPLNCGKRSSSFGSMVVASTSHHSTSHQLRNNKCPASVMPPMALSFLVFQARSMRLSSGSSCGSQIGPQGWS